MNFYKQHEFTIDLIVAIGTTLFALYTIYRWRKSAHALKTSRARLALREGEEKPEATGNVVPLFRGPTPIISMTRASQWLNSLWDPALGDDTFEILKIRMPVNGSDISALVLKSCNSESCCGRHLGTLPACEADGLIEYLLFRLRVKHAYLIGSFNEIIGIKLTNIEVTVHDHRKDPEPIIALHIKVRAPEAPRASRGDRDCGHPYDFCC
jgi:hypothetical protein